MTADAHGALGYDDPGHKVRVNESEMAALYEQQGFGRPLKLLYGTLTVLIDDPSDLWVLDVIREVRYG